VLRVTRDVLEHSRATLPLYLVAVTKSYGLVDVIPLLPLKEKSTVLLSSVHEIVLIVAFVERLVS